MPLPSAVPASRMASGFSPLINVSSAVAAVTDWSASFRIDRSSIGHYGCSAITTSTARRRSAVRTRSDGPPPAGSAQRNATQRNATRGQVAFATRQGFSRHPRLSAADSRVPRSRKLPHHSRSSAPPRRPDAQFAPRRRARDKCVDEARRPRTARISYARASLVLAPSAFRLTAAQYRLYERASNR